MGVILDHNLIYNDLSKIVKSLKRNKTNREVAVIITELEKVVAYYKMYVLDATE